MTPPQACEKCSPESCGKVLKKCAARTSKVSGRSSYAASMPLA
jgi:hypothetical protein